MSNATKLNRMFVIRTGTDIIGPFTTQDEAGTYAKDKYDGCKWSVVPLSVPEGVTMMTPELIDGRFEVKIAPFTAFTCYDVDPPITWNITALLADCEAGKFPILSIPTAGIPPVDYTNGRLDKAKVEFFKTQPDILRKPAIIIETPLGDTVPFLCFVDGTHRVTAMIELKLPYVRAYTIPHEAEKKYRVKV